MTTSLRPLPPFARATGAIIATVALLVALIASASPASAHARLEGSSPQDGSTLAAVPPEITLKFNEPIEAGLNEVSVMSGGTDVAEGEPQVEGNNVYQPIDFTMKPGEYTVTYKVVSADGHPVSGSFDFTYAPPESDGGAANDPEATPYSPSETATAAESDGSTGDESTGEEPTAEKSSAVESESPASAEETAEAAQSAQESQESQEADSTSPWWWAAAVGALIVVIGGLALLVRGRRDSEDEDYSLRN